MDSISSEDAVLETHFEAVLVFLSVLVASAGAFPTLTTASYLPRVRSRKWYFVMLVQSGLGLGVATTWSLHFIGMRATLIGPSSDSSPGKFSFDTGLTILSALFVWISSTIAIHVLHNKDKWKCSSLGGPLLATFWLALGIGGMHYLGLAAERGQFIARFDPWMIVLHVPILFTCSFLMILVIVHFPSFTLSRCAGSVLLASLVGIVHYFGMVPVSHWSHPKGWTWQILPLKHINVEAEVSIIVSLFCDFLLMASNAFYLEFIQIQEKSQMDKELEYRKHVADAPPLMKRCQRMQFPLTLVKANVFLQLGKLVQYETLRDQHLLVMVDTPSKAAKIRRKGGYIIFFSHQWLASSHPDPGGSQFKDMMHAVKELALQRMELECIYIWVDYCSIPQHSGEQQQLAINSLPAYVAACSAFIIVATTEKHCESHECCNFQSYATRFWCRLEVFCAAMTTMNYQLENMGAEQRVCMVADGRLDAMVFLDEHGVKSEYADLFQVYQGNANCCARNHRSADGHHLECDKHRVATTLVGLYGMMLVEAMRLRGSSLYNEDRQKQSFLELCKMLIEQRESLFPAAFFNSRIQAMHEYLDEVSKASGGTFDSRGETFRRDRWSSMSQVSKYDTDSPDSPDSPRSMDIVNISTLSAELCCDKVWFASEGEVSQISAGGNSEDDQPKKETSKSTVLSM